MVNSWDGRARESSCGARRTGMYEHRSRRWSPDRRSVWHGEGEHVTSRADGNVLHAVDSVSHGRGTEGLASIEVPEGLPVFRVDGFEGLRIVAKEDETSGSGESSSP